MILERAENSKKLYLHDHTSIVKYRVQYTTRMFLNTSEYRMSDGFLYALEACLVNLEQS